MYAIIIPFSQSFDDIGFTYEIPFELENILKLGMVVIVPFGNKEIKGLVVEISENPNIEKNKIKKIINTYNFQFLNEYQVELLKWISLYYFTLAHNSLGLFFPKNLENKILKDKFKFDEKLKESTYIYKNNKVLTQKQSEIFDLILNSKENKFLLYGVTGSGKTEIYINLIKYNLEKGRQSLFLVPEIILNNQLFERIKNVFGDDVLVINSSISEGKKTKYWQLIYENKAKIIIGTRSSIFYPYNNLGLIIMDEEHDNSYISDISPRYNSLEVVNKISDLTNCTLVLGSATPTINTMYDSLNGKYKLLNLFDEFN